MIKSLPKNIQQALTLLWEYSDDACLSGRTKAELEEEGYECNSDSAHYMTFVIGDKGDKP
jgi:hypothetical protein